MQVRWKVKTVSRTPRIVTVLFLLCACRSQLAEATCEFVASPELLAGLVTPEWSQRRALLEKRVAAFHQVRAHCPDGHFDSGSRERFYGYLRREIEYRKWAEGHYLRTGQGFGEGYGEYLQELRNYVDRVLDPERDRVFSDLILVFGMPQTVAKLGRSAESEVVTLLAVEDRQTTAAAAIGYWIDAANDGFTPDEKDRFISLLIDRLPSPPAFSDADRSSYWQSIHFADAILNALGRSNSVAARDAIRTWLRKFESRPVTGLRAPTEPLTVKAAREAIAAIEKHLAPKTHP